MLFPGCQVYHTASKEVCNFLTGNSGTETEKQAVKMLKL